MATKIANTLEEALVYKNEFNYIPYAGGTDLMCKEDDSRSFLFLNKIKQLHNIYIEGENLHIGALATFTEILENELVPNVLKDAISQIAAVAIRNIGTIGGNVGNASAKADSALILFGLDSLVCLQNINNKRIVKINDLYLGQGKLDILDNEIITEFIIPLKYAKNYYYQKIGARKSLAIARSSFVCFCTINNGIVEHFSTAFGAITPVIIRRSDIDSLLIGKSVSEIKPYVDELLKKYDEEIKTRSGRVSATYRKMSAMMLLKDSLRKFGLL